LEYDVDVSGVGAMDVSAKRSAAEFGANVIARNDDRATILANPRPFRTIAVSLKLESITPTLATF
jgi:hypothetical protein